MKRVIFVVVLLSVLADCQTAAVTKHNRVLRIGVRSDVRFIIVNPEGHSAGFDRNTGLPTTQIASSVPSEDCSKFRGGTGAEACFRQIEIENPVPGIYRMEVMAAQGGTFGLYWTDEGGRRMSERHFSNLPIATGELQIYDFTCAANPAEDWMRGDFAGAEAEGDADQFLTYGRPSSNPIKQAKGTASYSMIMVYGPTVLPASFRADLNGENVTNLFHPEPADAEGVHLPLRAGRNTLKVTINGRLADHTASDVDTLVFDVH